MPDKVLKGAGGTMARFTKLTECGELGACYWAFRCVATVERTAEYIDGTDISPQNMDGMACYVYMSPPELKWERATITLNAIPTRIKEALTGAPVYLNEDSEAVGNDMTRDMILNSHFGLELWLRQAGEPCDEDGNLPYVYYVAPWYRDGKIGQSTIGNQAYTLVIEDARSGVYSPWGVGPYNVERNSTTGVPRPMLTPIDTATPGQETLSRELVTYLAPPIASTECQDPTPVVAVAPTVGGAAVPRVLTFPLRPDNAQPDLPGLVDWDDGGPAEAVSSGTTVQHIYAAPGTYNVTYTPTSHSSPTFVSVDITVS